MGMDVHGIGNKEAYFRESGWGWHPLWDLCERIAPGLTAKVSHGHHNDGDGLNAEDSEALGVLLRGAIDHGIVAHAVEALKAYKAGLPDEDCDLCNQTGTREWTEGGQVVVRQCNKCGGTMKVRPFDTHYSLRAESVAEFAEFLMVCKGFTID